MLLVGVNYWETLIVLGDIQISRKHVLRPTLVELERVSWTKLGNDSSKLVGR